MKNKFLSLAIALLLLGMAATTAFAAPRTPVADVFVDHQTANQNTNYDGQELRLSGSADPMGACTATRTALLRFNLSDVTKTIGSAKLTVTTGNSAASSGAANRTVAVFQVANDSWNETTATYANTIGNGSVVVGPSVGTATLPSTDPIPSGQSVQFSGQSLVDFLNAQVGGDKTASIAVQFTSCATVSTQWFQDKEGGSVAATLELLDPTAVDLSTASAQQATSWPLYAGLGAVALIVVAGVMMSRRRTA